MKQYTFGNAYLTNGYIAARIYTFANANKDNAENG